jgi:hypothetical protein
MVAQLNQILMSFKIPAVYCRIMQVIYISKLYPNQSVGYTLNSKTRGSFLGKKFKGSQKLPADAILAGACPKQNNSLKF